MYAISFVSWNVTEGIYMIKFEFFVDKIANNFDTVAFDYGLTQ